MAREVGLMAGDQPGRGWTVVLRRQPARIVDGQPEGGYGSAFEIICCDCGDDPDLDYREVSPELQRIRGPYLVAAGVAAYERHVDRYHRWPGRPAWPAAAGAGRAPRSPAGPGGRRRARGGR